ncbi:alpha/beta fold hydrolase [Nocardia sp. SYP-A9097]|uniref:alpha/beta fold hydrolase n=1 Tax=Nocardia sp. SYP-A9097 TaxID=2663237 RepID=UPI00129AD8C8|nr:alpha/beta hydrolase [Nocardia sp. SYP-A9097]MRH87644.1 alpha/beta fold hydrolase [Nocardia sp. SYP-A9097]
MSDPAIQVVTSADGTPIEVLRVGNGPHVIVVPGALAIASDFTAFAKRLAARYTVHIVQRRGRGGSGPQGDRYGIARECEDIEAVRARTGARLLFGHSFGGLVALRAACANPAFDAVAVYEPGVSVDGSIPVDWIDRAHRETTEGADFEAFITFVRGSNPEQSGRIPRWLLRIILRHNISRAQIRQNLALMPQAIREHIEVGRFDAHLPDYSEIAATTLIMRGKGRATSRQAVALARLAGTIPRSESATFPALDHFAPEKSPDDIAAAVLRFFTTHAQPGLSTMK